MRYSETVNRSNIEFSNVKNPLYLFKQGPIGLINRLRADNGDITSIDNNSPFINAIDIDWNGVVVSDSLSNEKIINTTAELIEWIKSINISGGTESLPGDSLFYYITYTVNCYMWSVGIPETPTADDTDCPADWSKHIPNDPDTEGSKLWQTHSDVTYKLSANDNNSTISNVGPWSEPEWITISGNTAGEDNEKREFIYKLYPNIHDFENDSNSPHRLEAVQQNDYQPDGWNDNPEGVSSENKYEYFSYRDKVNGTWETFTKPSIWSHYGVDGKDGDGIEYIFVRTKKGVAPIISEDPYNVDALYYKLNEFKPYAEVTDDDNEISGSPNTNTPNNRKALCTDDNVGINLDFPFEWVLTRKKNGGEWPPYEQGTPMKLWAKYGKDGDDGDAPDIKIEDGHLIVNGVDIGAIESGEGGSEGIKIETLTGDEVEETSGTLSFKNCTNLNALYESYTAGFYSYDNQIYYYSGKGCNLIKLGDSSGSGLFLHVAYAKWINLNENNIADKALGFTIISTTKTKPWYGLCANDSEKDPGWDLLTSKTEIDVNIDPSLESTLATLDAKNAIAQYKWNYMPGKDGNGVEFIYTLTKDGKPGINQDEGFRYNDNGYYLKSNKNEDEFLPLIDDGLEGFTPNSSRPYFIIDGDPLPLPVLFVSDNYYIYDSEKLKISSTSADLINKKYHWYDDPPQDVDSTWKYRWRAQRKKTDGIWSDFGNVIEDDHWVAPNISYQILSNAQRTYYYSNSNSSLYFDPGIDLTFNFVKVVGGSLSSYSDCYYKIYINATSIDDSRNNQSSCSISNNYWTEHSITYASLNSITVVIGDSSNVSLDNYLAKYEILILEGTPGANGNDSIKYYITTNPSSISSFRRSTGIDSLSVAYSVMKEKNSLPLLVAVSNGNLYVDTINTTNDTTFYLLYRIVENNSSYSLETEWTKGNNNLNLNNISINPNSNVTGIQFILANSNIINDQDIFLDYNSVNIFYSTIIPVIPNGENGNNGTSGANPNLIDGTDLELVLDIEKDANGMSHELNGEVLYFYKGNTLYDHLSNQDIHTEPNYNIDVNDIDGKFYYREAILIPNMSLKYKRIKGINNVSSSFKLKIEGNVNFGENHFIRFSPYLELAKDDNIIHTDPENGNRILYIGFDCNLDGNNIINTKDNWLKFELPNLYLYPSSNTNFEDDDEFGLGLMLEIYGNYTDNHYPMLTEENLKITIKDIKLEEGSESTPWCLSENDKKGKDGKDGVTTTQIIQTEGELGKIILPMGYWNSGKLYTSDATITPLVYHDGKYYYLRPNVTLLDIIFDSSTYPVTYYEPGNTEQQGDNPWVEAEEYGVIITEGIFSDFSKLGSAIMSGDYMFSLWGTYCSHTVESKNLIIREEFDDFLHFNDFTSKKRPVPLLSSIYNYWNSNVNNVLTIGTITRQKNKNLVGWITGPSDIDSLYTPKFKKNGSDSETGATWDSAKTSTGSINYYYFEIPPESTDEGSDSNYIFLIEHNNGTNPINNNPIFYVEYTITPNFFPNWYVDLKSGKMVASGGNFIANPSGTVEAAKGNFIIRSDGTIETAKGNFIIRSDGTVEAAGGNFIIRSDGTVEIKGGIILTPIIIDDNNYQNYILHDDNVFGEGLYTINITSSNNLFITNFNTTGAYISGPDNLVLPDEIQLNGIEVFIYNLGSRTIGISGNIFIGEGSTSVSMSLSKDHWVKLKYVTIPEVTTVSGLNYTSNGRWIVLSKTYNWYALTT